METKPPKRVARSKLWNTTRDSAMELKIPREITWTTCVSAIRDRLLEEFEMLVGKDPTDRKLELGQARVINILKAMADDRNQILTKLFSRHYSTQYTPIVDGEPERISEDEALISTNDGEWIRITLEEAKLLIKKVIEKLSSQLLYTLDDALVDQPDDLTRRRGEAESDNVQQLFADFEG